MKRLGKRNRRLEGMEPESGLEVTMEGDLAIVIVDGEEVEAVKVEEGDDLVQVVEELKADYMEGRKGRRRLQEGTGETKREVMGNWVVYFDTDEAGAVTGISSVQHSKRLDTVFIETFKPFGKDVAYINVGWASAGSEGSKPELVQARIDLMQDAVDTVNALIKKYPELIRWLGK